MNLKKTNRYRFSKYQGNITQTILNKKSPKKKIKEIVLLFFSIIFLWIPFSISAAISNASLKMEMRDLWEKASLMGENITKNLSYLQENPTLPVIKKQKINRKRVKTQSIAETLPTFLPFNANMSSTKSIENAENNADFIKLSEIAELTNEKGQIVNEKMENPIWQKKEDLQTMIFKYFWHKVKKNESLWSIAQHYGISVESIITANHLNKGEIHTLPKRETLKIPHFSGIYHKIKNGDTLLKLSQKYKVSLEEIRKYNKIPNYLTVEKTIFLPQATFDEEKRQNLFGSIFSPPLKDGQVVSHYGLKFDPVKKKNIFHKGIDIEEKGSGGVYCIADGKIIKATTDKSYGKHVIIEHAYGYTSLYAHLSSIRIKEHQRIKRGAPIGFVRNTKGNKQTHLHFELRKNGQYINPKRFFNLK